MGEKGFSVSAEKTIGAGTPGNDDHGPLPGSRLGFAPGGGVHRPHQHLPGRADPLHEPGRSHHAGGAPLFRRRRAAHARFHPRRLPRDGGDPVHLRNRGRRVHPAQNRQPGRRRTGRRGHRPADHRCRRRECHLPRPGHHRKGARGRAPARPRGTAARHHGGGGRGHHHGRRGGGSSCPSMRRPSGSSATPPRRPSAKIFRA